MAVTLKFDNEPAEDMFKRLIKSLSGEDLKPREFFTRSEKRRIKYHRNARLRLRYKIKRELRKNRV